MSLPQFPAHFKTAVSESWEPMERDDTSLLLAQLSQIHPGSGDFELRARQIDMHLTESSVEDRWRAAPAGGQAGRGHLFGEESLDKMAAKTISNFHLLLPETNQILSGMSDRSPVSKILSDRLANLRQARRRLQMELVEAGGGDVHSIPSVEKIGGRPCDPAEGGVLSEGSSLDSVLECLLRESTDMAAEVGEAIAPDRGTQRERVSWIWVQESLQSLGKAMAILDVADGGRDGATRASFESCPSDGGEGTITGHTSRSLDMSKIQGDAEDLVSRSSYEMSSLWHGLLSGAHDDILDDDDDDDATGTVITDEIAVLGDSCFEEEVGHGYYDGRGVYACSLPRSVLGSSAQMVSLVQGHESPPAPAAAPPTASQQAHLIPHSNYLPSLTHTTSSVRSSVSLFDGESNDEHAHSTVAAVAGSDVQGDHRDKRIDALSSALAAIQQDLSTMIFLMQMRGVVQSGKGLEHGDGCDALLLVGRNLLNHSTHIEALSTSLAIIPPSSTDAKNDLHPLAISIDQTSRQLHSLLPASKQEMVKQEILDLNEEIAVLESAQSELGLQDVSTATLDGHELLQEERLDIEEDGLVRPTAVRGLGMSDCVFFPPANYEIAESKSTTVPHEPHEIGVAPENTATIPVWVMRVDASCQVTKSLQSSVITPCENEPKLDAATSSSASDCASRGHGGQRELTYHATGRYSSFVDHQKDSRAALAARIQNKGLEPMAVTSNIKEDCTSQGDMLLLLQERDALLVEMHQLCSLMPTHDSPSMGNASLLQGHPLHQSERRYSSVPDILTEQMRSTPDCRFCSPCERAELAARLNAKYSQLSSEGRTLKEERCNVASAGWHVLADNSSIRATAEPTWSLAHAELERQHASHGVGAVEMDAALEKFCQRASDLHVLKEAFLPASAFGDLPDIFNYSFNSTPWTYEKASPGRVLDLSGMDDEEDLLARLRKLRGGEVSELDLSGNPSVRT